MTDFIRPDPSKMGNFGRQLSNPGELITTARRSGYRGIIAALTATSIETEHNQLKAAGADIVFVKPLSKEHIEALIAERSKQLKTPS